jgi:hypothetical protein
MSSASSLDPKTKKAPTGCEAEGALAANRTRDERVALEMVELIALMGRVALRLHSTVVEIGYYVKRVVAATIAAIRVDV